MPEEVKPASENKFLYIRIAVSLALVAVSVFTDSFLSVISAIAATVISGYDIIYNAYLSFVGLNFFTVDAVSFISVIMLFAAGCCSEAAAVFPVLHIGLIFTSFAEEKSTQSALENLNYCNDKDKKKYTLLKDTDKLNNKNCGIIKASSDRVLVYCAVFSVLFAFLSHFIFNYSLRESLRRGAGALIICSSFTVVMSSKVLHLLGLCKCAAIGINFSDSDSLTACAECNVVAIEREGVLTSDAPESARFYSEVLDTDRMIMLCAHAVANSQQPFAKPILQVYSGEINKNIISGFKEISGVGVGVIISGLHAVLATSDYYNKRNIKLPRYENITGKNYYLTINNTYAGYVNIEEITDEAYISLTEKFREYDIERCALITQESKEAAEGTAMDYGFDIFYPSCYKTSFQNTLNSFSRKLDKLLFIHSELENFSAAHCSITVNHDSVGNHVYKDSIDKIPDAIIISDTVKRLEEENSIIVYIGKAISLMLAISGIGQAWFSIFLDLIFAAATYLNCFRLNLYNKD